MLNRFLIFVIFLVLAQGASAQQFGGISAASPEAKKVQTPPPPKASPSTPAIISSNGMLMDKAGFVIGVRNKEDPRGSATVFYYFGVNKKGKVSKDSKFKVFQDPNVNVPSYIQQSVTPYDAQNPTYDGTQPATKAQNAFVPSKTGVYEFGGSAQ